MTHFKGGNNAKLLKMIGDLLALNWIKDEFKIAGYYYVVNIINDSIAIVEEQKRGKTTGYFAYVDDMAGYHRWPTFEQALLCAVSIKLTGHEDATEWMWKLVG